MTFLHLYLHLSKIVFRNSFFSLTKLVRLRVKVVIDWGKIAAQSSLVQPLFVAIGGEPHASPLTWLVYTSLARHNHRHLALSSALSGYRDTSKT
jgi:hypothetical protein